MPITFDGKLVVAISSRALFDLSESHHIYETKGVEAYANKTVELYAGKAKDMQASLKEYPWESKEKTMSYWALNDVAAAYFILGTDHPRGLHTTQFDFLELEFCAICHRQRCTKRSKNNSLTRCHIGRATNNLDFILTIKNLGHRKFICLGMTITFQYFCNDETAKWGSNILDSLDLQTN